MAFLVRIIEGGSKARKEDRRTGLPECCCQGEGEPFGPYRSEKRQGNDKMEPTYEMNAFLHLCHLALIRARKDQLKSHRTDMR